MSFKIEVTDECIGCGACAAVSDNFKMVDNKAIPVNAKVDDKSSSEEGKNACPVDAIKIEEI